MATPNKYQRGKVYKLLVGSEIYVGSTYCTLAARLRAHRGTSKTDATRRLYEAVEAAGGWGAVGIELLELAPCQTRVQLLWCERLYYDLLRPTLNSQPPICNADELREAQKRYSHAHYEQHREQCKERMRQYHATHPRDTRQYHKEHYKLNKEAINAKAALYREANRDTINAKAALWREANRDTINAKKAAKRAEKKAAAANVAA